MNAGGGRAAARGEMRADWFRAYGVGVVDVHDEPPALSGEPEAGAGSAPEAEAADRRERGGVVYLGRLPDGPITILTGPSAVLYRALVEPVASPRARVESVARGLGVAPQDVDADAITEFAEELVAAGLLARTTGAS